MSKKILTLILIIVMTATLFVGCDVNAFLDNLQNPEGDTQGTTISDAVSSLGNANITLKTTENATAPDTITELVAKIRNSAVEIEVGNSTTSPSTNGSGVLFAKSQTYFYVVTNHHVIDGWDNFWVKLNNGERYSAVLKGSDENTDIAVLTILNNGIDESYDTVTVPSDDYEVRVGDTAIVIGTPLGVLGGTVTQGIVSALERQVTLENHTMTLMQTDAAVNGGNSGGGMFDIYGQLIGIVNAKSSGVGIEGIGFAIPIKTAVKTACDIIDDGKVTGVPGMGITVLTFASAEEIDEFLYNCNMTSSQLYEFWNNFFTYTNKSTGLYVYNVENPNCDLSEGDYIVSFKGQTVKTQAELRAVLDNCEIGETVSVVVKRNGETTNVGITLIEINS